MSSASALLSTTRTMGSSASSALDVVTLEVANRPAVLVRHRSRVPVGAVDVHERLVSRDHERAVGDPVGRELERHARSSDPRDADVDLELVIEPSGCEVLDVVRAHDELTAEVPVEQPESAVIFDAGKVEVRVVPPVIDDALSIRVRESHARTGAELERRLHFARDPTAQGKRSPAPVSDDLRNA